MPEGMTQTKFTFDKKLVPPAQKRIPPGPSDEVPFGRIPTDHMLVCDFLPEKGGWQTPTILPFAPFSIAPSAVVLHYGQEVFEGLKAYQCAEDRGSFYLFRHDQNAHRMYRSALRLGMEPVPIDLFMAGVEQLVAIETNWILPAPGSLYIRPALIGLDEGVSYRASNAYRFFICASPARNYYSKEMGVSVAIEREFVRACPGGCGEAKCGGNYAAALPGLLRAKRLGAEQVLWLDGVHRKYVEEVGAMNIMFVYGNKIVTPELSGSILPGVTRSSIIELARSLKYQVEETRIPIDEALADIRSGKITEVFGCGTAAVISPVDALIDGGNTVIVNDRKVGEISLRLKSALVDLQFGRGPDPFGWRTKIRP